MGGWWKWALVSPDGVMPSRMVGVSASVNLPLHHKVQKFSSGTGSPWWFRKKGRKMVVVWCGGVQLLKKSIYSNQDATSESVSKCPRLQIYITRKQAVTVWIQQRQTFADKEVIKTGNKCSRSFTQMYSVQLSGSRHLSNGWKRPKNLVKLAPCLSTHLCMPRTLYTSWYQATKVHCLWKISDKNNYNYKQMQ